MRLVFVGGLALLGHAFHAAFSMQEALQAHHHAPGGGLAFLPSLGSLPSGSESSGASLPVWIVLEVIVGFILALIGYVAGTKLNKIRLSDHQSEMRYEHAVYTDFIHFNHRGAVVSSRN